MFVKATNDVIDVFPYSVGALRRDNPNTSFPKLVPEEVMARFCMFPVKYEDDPEHNPETHCVKQDNVPTLKDGQWIIAKTVVALTPEQLDERNRAKASQVRNRRDNLLAKSDWLALSDNTLTADWATYRQALRDITLQAGFPHSVTWPTQPE